MPLYTPDGSFRMTPVESLLTDGGTGPNRRIRVDVGQTGFFAGREYRTFFEISTDAVIRVVVPVNTILFGLDLSLVEGEARLETVVGGTPAGSFDTTIPTFPRNTMTEVPVPSVASIVFTTGGTHTGGTILDVLLVKAASNSNFATSVGNNSSDERGVAAGTYYFRIDVTGTTRGVLKARWEERP